MIVSWTIKGNDVLPRFPQGRMISAEFAPQNNPNHTEREKTPPCYINTALTRLLICIDLSRHFLPVHHKPLRSQLLLPQNFIVIQFKDDYLTLFVTLPPLSSAPVSHLSDTHNNCCSELTTPYASPWLGQHQFIDARSSSAFGFIMCSSFLSSFRSQGKIFSAHLQVNRFSHWSGFKAPKLFKLPANKTTLGCL